MIKAVAGETIVLHRSSYVGLLRKILTSVCLLVVTPVVLSQGAPAGALPVSVIEVRPTSVPSMIEVTGQAEGAKETEVRARVNGILLQRLFVEGLNG